VSVAVKGARSGSAASERAVEFETRALRCPVCNTEFTAEVPRPGAPIGRDTDFRPRYAVVDPLPSLIHACPSCRYTAYREGYEETLDDSDEEFLGRPMPGDRPAPRFEIPGEDDLDDLRRWIRRGDLVRGIAEGREPYGAERYLLGARCYEFLQDDDVLGLADYYLRASWCARGAKDRELEVSCQRDSAAKLRHALEHSQVADTDKPRVTYLMAELARRSGEFPRAVDLFSQLDALIDPDDVEHAFLLALAKRQLALAVVQSDVDAFTSVEEMEAAHDEE
jgi:hypothetical protein